MKTLSFKLAKLSCIAAGIGLTLASASSYAAFINIKCDSGAIQCQSHQNSCCRHNGSSSYFWSNYGGCPGVSFHYNTQHCKNIQIRNYSSCEKASNWNCFCTQHEKEYGDNGCNLY